jgi:hypothetical protein
VWCCLSSVGIARRGTEIEELAEQPHICQQMANMGHQRLAVRLRKKLPHPSQQRARVGHPLSPENCPTQAKEACMGHPDQARRAYFLTSVLRPLRGLGLRKSDACPRLAPWGYRLLPATRATAIWTPRAGAPKLAGPPNNTARNLGHPTWGLSHSSKRSLHGPPGQRRRAEIEELKNTAEQPHICQRMANMGHQPSTL